MPINDVQDLKVKKEGDQETLSVLDPQMSDEEIAQAIGNRIEAATTYWNKELQLDDKRTINKRYWKAYDNLNKDLYPYQVDYNDPVSAVAVETLLPMETSKPPEPLVIPVNEDDASAELGDYLTMALKTKYEDDFWKAKSMKVVRHLSMGMRCAWMKPIWNPDSGGFKEDGSRMGDYSWRVLPPQNVICEDSDDPTRIPLIAEKITKSLEEFASEYPDSRDALYRECGISAGVAEKLSKKITAHEVHFTSWKNDKQTEIIVTKFNKVIMDKNKTPFWNYDETDENGQPTNFLPYPQKPYILFTHMNTGEYLLDDNSLMDLARNQQDIVNKRGRQIVENADQGNSGLIYDTEAIKPEEMAKLIGDPGEKIGVKGNVNNAVTRIPPPPLAQWVLNDKQDARNRINDIFGTNNPIRGQESQSATLGQDVLSQRSDMSRGITMSTSLEDGFDRVFKFSVQIMKVFYDEFTKIPVYNSDGNITRISLSGTSIKPGTVVRVKTGSTIPEDPVTKAVQATKLAPVLDPLTLFEELGYQNAKDKAIRVIKYRLMPQAYMQDILGESVDGQQADPSAIQEIQFMEQGQEAPPQQSPSQAHLATHQQDLESPQNQQRPAGIQQLIVNHVKAEIANSKQQLGMPMQQNGGQMNGQNMQPMGNQPPQTNTTAPPQEKTGLLNRILGRK